MIHEIDYKKKASDYKEERDQLAEEINRISELLLGYREGTFAQIIQAIAEYKTKAFKYKENKEVEKLFSLIDDLADAKSDIIDNT